MLHIEGSGGLMRRKIAVLEVGYRAEHTRQAQQAQQGQPAFSAPEASTLQRSCCPDLLNSHLQWRADRAAQKCVGKDGLPQVGKSGSLSPASFLLFTPEPHTTLSQNTTGIFWRRLAGSLVDDVGMKKRILAEARKLDLQVTR